MVSVWEKAHVDASGGDQEDGAQPRQLGRCGCGAGEDDLSALMSKPEYGGTLTVRQMYARLLLLGGRAGYLRKPHQTPIEYMRVLSSALPSLEGEFADITSAYIEARYGERPASSGAVQAAASAWRRAEPVLSSEVTRQRPN